MAPTVQELAQDIADSDAALMDSLIAKNGVLRNPAPAPAPARPTIVDNFIAAADLIVEHRRRTRLSETSLIRLLELQMMWHLNNRPQPQPQQDFFTPEAGEGATSGDEGEAPSLPEADEVITGTEE